MTARPYGVMSRERKSTETVQACSFGLLSWLIAAVTLIDIHVAVLSGDAVVVFEVHNLKVTRLVGHEDPEAIGDTPLKIDDFLAFRSNEDSLDIPLVIASGIQNDRLLTFSIAMTVETYVSR